MCNNAGEEQKQKSPAKPLNELIHKTKICKIYTNSEALRRFSAAVLKERARFFGDEVSSKCPFFYAKYAEDGRLR